MKERTTQFLGLMIIAVYAILAFLLAAVNQSDLGRFPLAFFPLFVVLFGVAFMRQSGLTMALIGLVITIILVVSQFETPSIPTLGKALGASMYGFIKGFGISISVAATMLMIYVMREAGALQAVSKVIKQQVVGDEFQALYIGIGFGSFLTALGVVTPALFPPLLVMMGFTPTAAVAISVLGYDPTTSFSLLSIPITLPAQTFGFNPIDLAFKVAIFLPLISTGFAFALLWVVGKRELMKKGIVPALVAGLSLATACLAVVSIDHFVGTEVVPLRVVGIIGGLFTMFSLYVYQHARRLRLDRKKPDDYPSKREIWRSFSPWVILTILAALVSIPIIQTSLANVLGSWEQTVIPGFPTIDLDVLAQIYTWILVSIVLSFVTLRITRDQLKKAFKIWTKRFPGPFLTFGLYFSIAFVMNYSPLNQILGSTLATVFGAGYIFVAASLGLLGAIAGGSETTSNVLFYNIQKTAVAKVGYSESFMTVYGSHAVAGGIASAVTPAKINNAVVCIDAGQETEAQIMRKHLIVALLLTIVTGVLTGIFVNLGI